MTEAYTVLENTLFTLLRIGHAFCQIRARSWALPLILPFLLDTMQAKRVHPRSDPPEPPNAQRPAEEKTIMQKSTISQRQL